MLMYMKLKNFIILSRNQKINFKITDLQTQLSHILDLRKSYNYAKKKRGKVICKYFDKN